MTVYPDPAEPGRTEPVGADPAHAGAARAETVRVETARADTPRDDRPLTSLFSELATETSALIRKEIELGKAEMSEKAAQAGKGAASLAIGGAVAYAGLIFLLLAATLALSNAVAPWLAALIVGAVVVIIGLVMLASGRNKLKASNLAPNRTIETIKDDGRWAKAQVGR